MASDGELDFAYRYPFSGEAKAVVRAIGAKPSDPRYLALAKARVEGALEKGKLQYVDTNYGEVKRDGVAGYAYAKMLVSALSNVAFAKKYAEAEARRSAEALDRGDDAELAKLAKELGLRLEKNGAGDYIVGFAEYLSNMPLDEGYNLSNQRLGLGMVVLGRKQVIKVAEAAMRRAIEATVRAKATVPEEVQAFAKGIRLPEIKVVAGGGAKTIRWIERLLSMPIADCRHRTVNLILAPYLVTIKGLEVQQASDIIVNYINLCKTVNPDTKVNETYIKYQCAYAKEHGLKPLALKRAMDELSSGIDFSALTGDVERGTAKA